MAQFLHNLPIGSQVKFGKYQVEAETSEEIVWTVVAKNHTGYPSNSVTLHSTYILDLRCFDGKEPKNEVSDRSSYGNNRYSVSNINNWLNSKSGAGHWYKAQHTYDQPPTADFIKGETAYDSRSGFLNLFSKNEYDAIIATPLCSLKPQIDGGGYENVKAKIFLPSIIEVGLSNSQGADEGVDWGYYTSSNMRCGYLTTQAYDNSLSSSKPTSDKNTWEWLTRTPYTFTYSVQIVNTGGTRSYKRANIGSVGIRPALNLSSALIVSDTPDSDGCYTFEWEENLVSVCSPKTISFEDYKKKIMGDFRPAIKVEWLNPDESVNFEFTDGLYDINVNLSVNYQNGSRRSCTLTLNNDKDKFPIDFNNIWIGQKFKLWMGIYIDEETPYYFPQGVFYVSNPSDTYNPSTRTVTINGVDKWAYLDGTLFGKLSGTYQTNVDVNLYDAIRELLKISRYKNDFSRTSNVAEMIDPVPPLLSPYFLTKTTDVTIGETTVTKSVLDCPYTATVERGQSFADVLLEYATILCAKIYYDVNGRLVLEPMIDTADDITDTNKEILWDYTVDEKTFLGLTQTFNFDKVYNDFIVLGNITNGYQFKGRVQNRNPMSNTCVQRIGLKTKEPYEDNQYVSDEQCVELAKYYAKTDTILQKSGDISSVVLFHLDVDKLVTVSTPNNNMSKELFLITGFSLSSSGSMTVNVTSINILKDFSVVEAKVNE